MNRLTTSLGFWSATIIALLVFTIDAGMISSAILYPATAITSAEAYANTFNSLQMLPFIPSLVLLPLFATMMLCLHHYAPDDKKILSQLGFSFSLICTAILSLHYYIQLTVVQTAMINNEAAQVWQFAAPNPKSFFWTFAALGYGFMGIALLTDAPVFQDKTRLLLVANGIVGIGFLIGNALGIFAVNILASFIWGVLFPVTALVIAKTFKKAQPSKNTS